MTSKPSDFMLKKWADESAADVLRQRHERIGRLVVEHKEVLKVFLGQSSARLSLPSYAPEIHHACSVLEGILKEVDS